MRGWLPLLALALRSPGLVRKFSGALRELRGYMASRVVEVAEPLIEKPWFSWADKELAFYLYSALVGEGVARWRQDGSLELVKRPEPPRIRMPEDADGIPVIDMLVQRLPEALEGRKYLLPPGGATGDRGIYLAFAKFLDNLGYNWLRRVALSLLLPRDLRAREGAVLVDVGAGMGLSTLAILELCRGTVVAVDPFEENLRSLEDYAALRRLGGRVRALRGYAETFRLESPADAAVMINVLHWCDSPREALRNVARNVRSRGYVAIAQAHRDHRGSWTGTLCAYLLGSRLPPPRKELYRMLRDEGLKVERSYALPAMELILARVP